DLEIGIAGQFFTQSFSAAPNQATTFTWVGKDVYGRTVQGAQSASVRIGYTYDGVYQQTPRFGSSGNGIPITGIPTRREVTLWQPYLQAVGGFDFLPLGLGAWSLNVHHVYDVNGKVLYLGNG